MTSDNILSALTAPKEGTHLGDLCGWSLHGTFDRETVEQATEQLGLENDFQLPRLTAVNAYRRAAVEACKDAARQDQRGWSAELVQNDEDYIVHELVRKQIKSGGNSALTDKTTEFASETRIRFDKIGYRAGRSPETLVELEHPSHPMAARAAQLFVEYLTKFRANDIRSGFQRAFETWDGMRVLEHGGLWVIPSPHAEKVRAWKEWLHRLGCSSIIIPVFDTEETIASMRAMAEDNLEGQLARILGELESFSTKENTRVSTLESRLESFDTLRSKTEMYERLLGMKMEALKTRLSTAASSLKSSLASLG